MRQTILVALAAVVLAAPQAGADVAGDVAAVRAAVAAVDRATAEAAVADAGPVARAVLRWRHLRAGTDDTLTFADYRAFTADRPDWPGLERLRREGEAFILPETPPEQIIAWFGDAPAQTPRGALALADALHATGRDADADEVMRRAWLSLGLSGEEQGAFLARWGRVLAPLVQARIEAMLWRTRTADAERMLPLLSGDARALAQARIALIRRAGDAWRLVAALPAAVADDAGLARDRMAALVHEGRREEAVALMLGRAAGDLGNPAAWAGQRADLARWLIRQGRPREALALASAHGLQAGGDTGAAFTDLEWIAGRAALQAGDAATARQHFAASGTAAPGVPAQARAAFWAGRAAGDAGAADYARAADLQPTFYGLLAAEHLGRPLAHAALVPGDFGDWRSGAALGSDLVKAMLLLEDAGETGDAALFALKLGQTLPREGIGQLGQMLDATAMPFLAATMARAAAERGIALPFMQFPMHPLSGKALPVAPDLLMAVARQESAFNPRAGSGAGAQGLLQLMPATAEEVARGLGLPWERARLTGDWEYNATLGAAYLAQLQAMFGNSPVLIAAGYNAGPSRPRTWIAERGDPRRGEVDPVDWIEDIPFDETRAYVMRVLEGIPVYRARLSGDGGAIGITALIRGELPRIRPRARGQVDATPPGYAPVAALRPVARP
ncbi:MAG: lytic transglycosylase domain-containing protein [Rubellimicrobium sp.]|nr:lytic transglycosylase domain-containing protein [Rubellimicrobium sp.]